MRKLTVEELKKIMRQCAGDDGGSAMDGDITDIGFDELGYDSLALLETAGYVQRAYGVTFAGDGLAEVNTPGEFVRSINALLEETA
jgi:act minimal PKS acyl carrier protein